MDRYMLSYSHSDPEVPHACPSGHQWTAAMTYELGGWFYQDDNQAYCPCCGAEAVEGC